MPATSNSEQAGRLVLAAATATDLMNPNPVSLRADATVSEAVAFLTAKGFSAAPVIDAAGRPVGVLSQADLMVHQREQSPPEASSYFHLADLAARFPVSPAPGRETMLVEDLMTPAVFSVPPEATAKRVITDMVGLKVHRLFVVDANGVLVGVISALDVLRHLQPAP
jgi:CBS domain-containing protein